MPHVKTLTNVALCQFVCWYAHNLVKLHVETLNIVISSYFLFVPSNCLSPKEKKYFPLIYLLTYQELHLTVVLLYTSVSV